MLTDAAAPIEFRSAARMLRPVHANLIACAVLAAVAAAAGLLAYIAIGEIARLALTGAVNPDAVWLWVGVGAGGAFVRLVCLGLDSHIGHHADAKMLHHLRERIVTTWVLCRWGGSAPPGPVRSRRP